MKNWWKITVVLVVVGALVAIAQMKMDKEEVAPPAPGAAAVTSPPAASAPAPASAACPVTAKPGEVCPVKPGGAVKPSVSTGPSAPSAAPAKPVAKPGAEKAPGLPRMLDLGAVGCLPCNMMVQVMDALKQDYAGKLTVEFINVNQDPAAAEKYGVQSIPTQILFDKTGKEVFRHIGFWPKEEIVAKCRELGFGL